MSNGLSEHSKNMMLIQRIMTRNIGALNRQLREKGIIIRTRLIVNYYSNDEQFVTSLEINHIPK